MVIFVFGGGCHDTRALRRVVTQSMLITFVETFGVLGVCETTISKWVLVFR